MKEVKRGFEGYCWVRKSILCIDRPRNCFSPERLWEILQDTSSHSSYCLVEAFSNTIRLRGIWSSCLMDNTLHFEEFFQGLVNIFTTVVCSESLYLRASLTFNYCNKILEGSRSIRFLFEEVDPREAGVIINACQVIGCITQRLSWKLPREIRMD